MNDEATRRTPDELEAFQRRRWQEMADAYGGPWVTWEEARIAIMGPTK